MKILKVISTHVSINENFQSDFQGYLMKTLKVVST